MEIAKSIREGTSGIELVKVNKDSLLIKTEIFIDERIITRFSTNILAAYYYPDKQHIIVQIEKENNQNQTEFFF